MDDLAGSVGRTAKTGMLDAMQQAGVSGIPLGGESCQDMSKNGRRFGMDQIQDDQTAVPSRQSETDNRLSLMHQEALRRIYRAYEDAFDLGNLPLHVINSGIIDKANAISRDEYIRRLMRDANISAIFAENIGLISSQEHQQIRKDFFIRHPELTDMEWDPRKERPTLESIARNLGLSDPSELESYMKEVAERRSNRRCTHLQQRMI
ncbi:MAG: hypothetical protein IT306_25745 [Chloroflexi bacterium]|nr:hypothetical protein [Chloroflexota bacterium]